jgi:hypothetical protein
MVEKPLNQFHNKLLLIIGGLLIVSFINYASIKHSYSGGKFYNWIEAENANEIHDQLFIIEGNEASGNKMIASKAKSHSINSYSVYNVSVGQDGEYQLWARLYGINACGNSYLVSVDNSNRYLVGNTDLMHCL